MSERLLSLDWTFDLGAHRFGFQVSPIYIDGMPYMWRYIIYLGIGTLRLHKFFAPDDARAPHSHPWSWWVTFPFTPYWERVWAPDNGCYLGRFVVKAWRFHKRNADYRHIVEGRADRKTGPYWTLCLTSQKAAEWGFYPEPNKYVHWKDWK